MMKTISELIVQEARKLKGQKELINNSGFKDEKFLQLMKAVGWQTGQAWCAYTAELIWKLAYSQYNSLIVDEINKLFNAGAVATWNSFRSSDYVCNQDPVIGSIVIWQHYENYKAQWTGHAGIVVDNSESAKLFNSIEGNTNARGGREGIEVAERTRPLNFDKKVNGIVLLGFIHPKE